MKTQTKFGLVEGISFAFFLTFGLVVGISFAFFLTLNLLFSILDILSNEFSQGDILLTMLASLLFGFFMGFRLSIKNLKKRRKR